MTLTMLDKSSLIESLISLPKEQRLRALQCLTEAEAEALLYDWPTWARPNQLPPDVNWYIWLLISGRGFGKTRTGAETVRMWAQQGFTPIALVGQTKADVRDTMVELGDSSILGVSPKSFMPEYEPSKRRLTWPNGVRAVIYSGDEPDQLRGPQNQKAWVDELAKFKYPQETWDNLMFGLRTGSKPQAIVTTTPRPIPIIKALIADSRTVVTKGHTLDNRDNLAPESLAYLLSRYEGTRLGRQELGGEVLGDNPGALWKRDNIEANRVREIPELVQIVVAIDPEATSGEESAETGIIGAGRSKDGQAYILEDASLRASPDGWGRAAVTTYHKLKADRLIGEVNNGGEMIEHTIRTVERNVPFKAVHASRGKQLRAEPVAALYEQNKIHHVGCFPQLEDQLCEWVAGEKSPDRLDALVWALTELMLGTQARVLFV